MAQSKIRFLPQIGALLILFFVISVDGIVAEKVSHEVVASVWSPDGSMIATSEYNPAHFRVWRVTPTGFEIFIDQPGVAVTTISWKYNSKRLLTLGTGGLRILNTDANDPNYAVGAVIYTFNELQIVRAEWSPTGEKLATLSSDGYYDRLWNTTNDSYTLLDEQRGGSSSLAWHPTGNKFVSTGDIETHIIDANAYTENTIANRNGSSLDWSPNGEEIVISDSNGTHIYNLEQSEFEPRLTIPTIYFGLKWSPDGTRIAGIWRDSATSMKVAVFEVDDGEVLANYPTTENFRSEGAMNWSPDGQLTYPAYVTDSLLPPIVTPPMAEHDQP